MQSMIPKIFLLSLLLILAKADLKAQGTLADYRRAAAVDTLFKDKVYNNPWEFHWLKKGDKVWYLNKRGARKEFMLADVKKKNQHPAFDHDRLARSLALRSGKKVDAAQLPFSLIEFSDDQKFITFRIDSARWKCNLSSYACEVTEVIKNE